MHHDTSGAWEEQTNAESATKVGDGNARSLGVIGPSKHRAEVDRECFWILMGEGNLDTRWIMPRAMEWSIRARSTTPWIVATAGSGLGRGCKVARLKEPSPCSINWPVNAAILNPRGPTDHARSSNSNLRFSFSVYSATYSYLANSPLVSQVVFKQSTTTRSLSSRVRIPCKRTCRAFHLWQRCGGSPIYSQLSTINCLPPAPPRSNCAVSARRRLPACISCPHVSEKPSRVNSTFSAYYSLSWKDFRISK